MDYLKKNKLNILFVVAFSALFILSLFYIVNTWRNGTQKVAADAVLMSQIAATGINGEAIQSLRALPEDQGTYAFESVRNRLEDYLNLNEDLSYVYLYTGRDGKLYFMADSASPESDDFLPPGQEYTEAEDEYYQPFRNKELFITEPVTDRWGTWITVLNPIIDPETGEVFAVLGMDYPAEIWQAQSLAATTGAAVQMFVAFLLALIIFYIFKQNKNNEERLALLISNIPGAIYRRKINAYWKLEFISEKIYELSGYIAEDFIHKKKTLSSIIYQEDFKAVKEEIEKAINERQGYKIQYRIKTRQHEIVWVEEYGTISYDISGRPVYIDGIIFDVSKDKKILSDIKDKQAELEKINRYMVGRELKMVELKKQLKDLDERE